MIGEFDKYVSAGYQDSPTGRRLGVRRCWSDLAFEQALGVARGMTAPTQAQRRAGYADGQ